MGQLIPEVISWAEEAERFRSINGRYPVIASIVPLVSSGLTNKCRRQRRRCLSAGLLIDQIRRAPSSTSRSGLLRLIYPPRSV